MAPDRSSSSAGSARAWLVWWVVCAAEYLALVDNVTGQELVAAAVLASIGATAAVAVRAGRLMDARGRVRWLGGALRASANVVTDLRPLAVALWRRGVRRRDERGSLSEVPYAAVGDDPVQAGHRVATVMLGSAGPNTIVVDVDGKRGVLVVHELVPSGDAARAARPLGEDAG